MLFSELLLEWFSVHGRKLPWRNCGNPYHIWVSEVILQQTRVSQGMDYFLRFVEQFPTVEALAAAPLDAVMKSWQGLGYYTRARNLHKAAQLIVNDYGGELPNSYKELLKLPGLGPYAAGAVASFAFHEPVPAIDGNVYRVLARVFGVFDSPGTDAGKKAFYTLCSEVMDHERPHLFNQAIIDFGALQCTPGRPDCTPCPMRGLCYAEANGLQTGLPTKERELKVRPRFFHFIMARWQGDTFIELRQGKDIWHSLYQFPLIETKERVEPTVFTESEEFQELVGTDCTVTHISEEKRQLLSHQELFIRFYIVELHTLPYALLQDYQRVPIDGVDGYQVPITIANYLAAEEAGEYFRCSSGEGED
jgi:A/G-specific adenine glycosylase